MSAQHDGLIDGCSEGVDTMIDIGLLAQAQFLVGKFSSNIDRVAYSMMVAQTGMYQPFISLDNAWCFDFGVSSRVDVSNPSNPKTYFC